MSKLRARHYIFWLISLPTLTMLMLGMVLGSRMLINPTKLEATCAGDVVMKRSYPLSSVAGYPMVRYVQTVTPIDRSVNGGYICREDNGRGNRYNHDARRGFGAWNIQHFAEPCLESDKGYVLSITYTALAFDLIPLRPVTIQTMVVPSNGRGSWCANGSNGGAFSGTADVR